MHPIMALLYLFLFVSCSTEPCEEIPSRFTTYKSAIEAIQSADFRIEEKLNTDRSSWIRSARYYSCNGIEGYALITTDKTTYVHTNVPYELWKSFNAANSFGRFYNSRLKEQYQLNLQ